MVGLHRKRGSRLDFTNDLPWIVVTRMREWKSLGTSGNIMVSFLFIHVGADPDCTEEMDSRERHRLLTGKEADLQA